MLIAIRHGKTEFNHSASGKERVRGYLPVPLTKEGMTKATEVAQMLATKVKNPVGIFSSDTVRAVQSAHELGKAFNLPIRPSEKLRSFDTGNLDGKPLNDTALKTIEDAVKHPTTPIPGGESYQAFMDRVVPILTKMVTDPKPYLLIGHGRVLTLLKALCDGKGDPKPSTLLEDVPVDPSGIMVVGRDWKLHYSSPKADTDTKNS